jgi:UDP-3-O-[3-hydroxymyristoyl] glucosamine N-acyltransferase
MKFDKPYTLKEVASWVGGEPIGDASFEIRGINEIHVVEPGDITFVDHPKYYKKALNSDASVVIINQKMDPPEGKALIFHNDPFVAYNSIIRRFSGFSPSQDMINDSAVVGEGTVIQPGVFIGENVKIGKNCVIHANVTIYHDVIIGDNVIIHSGTVIGADAFYFQRRKDGYHKMVSCGRVIIKDNVEIGANCTIDRGVSADTIIGEGTKLDNLIQIGHDTVIGKNCLFAAQVGVAGAVKIKDNVILWGQVGVQKDLTIGENVVVLGQSGVSSDLESGKTYFGSPAKDARDKMKELVYVTRIPEILDKLKEITEE